MGTHQSHRDEVKQQKQKQKQKQQVTEPTKTLKEGERILAPTRRPDGTLRKAIRIRAGYVPQDEVAIYHPKPSLKTCHDPQLHAIPKSKSKSVKRNERKKEKRLQAVLEKDKNLEPTEDSAKQEAVVDSLTSRINELAVSSIVTPTPGEGSEPIAVALDLDKRIRALKKKIRRTEALQQQAAEQDMKPEQLEKLAKQEDWRKELKLLEDKKTETPAA